MTSVRPQRDPESTHSPFGALLEAAQAGSGASFEELYRWLAPSVAGYLRAQGARDATEDLTSEVFLGVFRGIRSFTGSASDFRTWVFSIAHRRMVDERRKWARRPVVVRAEAGEMPHDGADTAEAALERMSSERVERLCARLSPPQRDVLLLRMVCDLTIEQVARLLGRSVGGTKALQRRGLAAVQRLLDAEGHR